MLDKGVKVRRMRNLVFIHTDQRGSFDKVVLGQKLKDVRE